MVEGGKFQQSNEKIPLDLNDRERAQALHQRQCEVHAGVSSLRCELIRAGYVKVGGPRGAGACVFRALGDGISDMECSGDAPWTVG